MKQYLRDHLTPEQARKYEYISEPRSIRSFFKNYKGDKLVYVSPINKNAKSVIIPDGIKIIADNAFADCKNLQEVHIPDSVTYIGDRAFEDCSSLKEIHIPDSVTEIGERAFRYCDALEEIHIPGSLTHIENRAFENCEKLKKIYISDGVETIGSEAFLGCSSLREIRIPDSVTDIWDAAFKDCTSLEKIIIPNGIRSISDYMFQDCSSLKEIHIPNSVEDIGLAAFERCSNLKNIDIPLGVKGISSFAFNDCKSLQKIYIPDSVVNIGDIEFYHDGVFENCINLQEIRLPDHVGLIGENMFFGCENLKEVHIPSGAKIIEFVGIRDSSFNKETAKKILPPNCSVIEDITPAKVQDADRQALQKLGADDNVIRNLELNKTSTLESPYACPLDITGREPVRLIRQALPLSLEDNCVFVCGLGTSKMTIRDFVSRAVKEPHVIASACLASEMRKKSKDHDPQKAQKLSGSKVKHTVNTQNGDAAHGRKR